MRALIRGDFGLASQGRGRGVRFITVLGEVGRRDRGVLRLGLRPSAAEVCVMLVAVVKLFLLLGRCWCWCFVLRLVVDVFVVGLSLIHI